MKTKIFMMTALLALLATGCGKDKFNGFRIVAENMQVANDGSKLVVNPNTMAAEWCAGEKIMVNDGNVYTIGYDDEQGYNITGAGLADEGGYYYAIYPGDDFDGNDVDIDNSIPGAPVITLNSLTIDMASDGSTHHVAFPMGAKAAASATTMEFKHLTAAFRLTLHATAAAALTQLRVYVYGNSSAVVPASVDHGDGAMDYTVQWANTGLLPNLPVGPVGDIEDRDLKYGSEMIFNLKTAGVDGMSFGAGTDKTFCIPVTLTQAKRLTVVGYNGETMVFAKTSDLSAHLTYIDRNTVYPVKTININ
jgi:hypothetical protein